MIARYVCAFLFFLCCQTSVAQVPELTGRVVDLADVLSEPAELAITHMSKAHEDSTGNQLAVLTIPSLDGEAIETYSLRVARDWALGSAEQNNGVLLLIAVEDREMRIEVGLGLEGTLTDLRASRILRGDIRTHFRNGDFDAGVSAAVMDIIGVLDGTYEPPDYYADGPGDTPPFFFGIVFLAIPSLFMFIGMLSRGFAYWFMMIFLIPFMLVGGAAITQSWNGALIVVGIYLAIYLGSRLHPKSKAIRRGETVSIGPFKTSGFTSSSGSGGSWSSGGGWSSSGSSFSGGGGSFGGGGSSGSW